MGCDIHVFLEVFDKDNNKWAMVTRINPGYEAVMRNYPRFYKLAGG